jgi:peptidoglycan/LPS O-acetylase OafA/YrhL
MSDPERLHALDTVRAFALLLGIAFHAALPFVPGLPKGIWAVVDASPSLVLGEFAFFVHIFRMTLFFFIAGFFARLLLERCGTRGFWANRAQRILIPLLVGWGILAPVVTFVWIVGLRREFGGVLPQPPASVPHPPAAFPLLHLWFLYNLLIFYVIVFALRAVLRTIDQRGVLRAGIDRIVSACLNRCVAGLPLAVPVGLSLLTTPNWVYLQGISTPDQSLIPTLPAFVSYGVAVSFGFLVQRQPGNLGLIQRRWVAHLLLALAATAVCFGYLGLKTPVSPVPTGTAKVIYAAAYGIACWGWTLAITGAALTFASAYSPLRRYLADSSYWLYLAHLPLVAGLAVWVGHWPLSWSIKYPLTLALSLSLLLLSYHFLVRPTFIGKALNGKRYPIRKPGGELTHGASSTTL